MSKKPPPSWEEIEAIVRNGNEPTPELRAKTMADIPRLPRRAFLACIIVPVLVWAVCDRWWRGTKSIFFMIWCDWREDVGIFLRDWRAP